MNIKTSLVVLIASSGFVNLGKAFASDNIGDDWSSKKQSSAPVVEGFSKEIIHHINAKSMVAKPLLEELSRRSKLIPITEKSTEKRRVSTDYFNATVDEIAGGVLNQAGLKSKLLTDNMIWIDAHEPEPGLYRRENCGANDKNPPFSIEHQRIARLRAESRARQQREAQAEAMREWQMQSHQSFEYYKENVPQVGAPKGNFFVPPPPPAAPGFLP